MRPYALPRARSSPWGWKDSVPALGALILVPFQNRTKPIRHGGRRFFSRFLDPIFEHYSQGIVSCSGHAVAKNLRPYIIDVMFHMPEYLVSVTLEHLKSEIAGCGAHCYASESLPALESAH